MSVGTGGLVRWPDGPGSPLGVIRELTPRQVRVEFDDGSERMFATANAPLEPVHLSGQVVRRSTGEAGVIVDGPVGSPPAWKVTFPTRNGRFVTKNVPEQDLRPYMASSPDERMKELQLARPRQANLALVARHYDIENRTNDLVSLSQARVDLKPYQVSVVHRVVSEYPHRFLLCDEVGLGKTIEAGMILKELRARGGARRTLIIVPPNLVRQWQFELKTKFNETFSVLNKDTIRYLRSNGYDGNPFAWTHSVLVSSSWLTWGNNRRKWAAEVDWDMVILDEAHHARSKRYRDKIETTRLYRVMRELASPETFGNRALLLLTATPMQLDTHELYSLVEFLDPALFPSEKHFEQHRRQVPGLNRLVDDLRENGFSPEDDDADQTVSRVAEWLDVDEQLARKRLTAGEEEIASLCDDLSEQHLLSRVLIRNRKSVVGGFMPRRAHRWEVELTAEEIAGLDAVEDYVSGGWDQASRTGDNAVGFVMTIFQKLMASSIRALRQSLLKRRNRLVDGETSGFTEAEGEQLLADDAEVSEVVASARAADEVEIAELTQLVEHLSRIRVDSKARVLLDHLATIFEDGGHDGDHDAAAPDCPNPDSHQKVLIFSEFRETQVYLKQLLEERGWTVNLFHGQLSPEQKDGSVADFRDGDGPQILISTEAGGEGRNFQFCHMLVNYDLPWNPMKVEQRIGRVDRIGQDHVVQVFNLWVRGTIEERILDVLERRINVFEETVGGLDPILGETERDLREVLRLREQERDEALHRLEEQLEQQVREARRAGEKLADFIMDTKSFSREIAERISGESSPISPELQERFVTSLLADVNTWIGPKEGGEHEIMFHEPFISDYQEFSGDGRRRRAVFRADDVQDAEHVEYFAFGHPIVDALLDRVLDEQYEGNTCTRRVRAAVDLPPAEGWLATYTISVPGLEEHERLVPVFVDDDGGLDEEYGWALLRRATHLDDRAERPIPPEDVPEDGIDGALDVAQHYVRAIANNLEEEVREESRRVADDERAKLEAYFDYRQRAAEDRVEATRATLQRLESSADSDRKRVVPLWRSNLERDERLLQELGHEREERLAAIDRRLSPSADWALVSFVRVEVIAPTSVWRAPS